MTKEYLRKVENLYAAALSVYKDFECYGEVLQYDDFGGYGENSSIGALIAAIKDYETTN